MIKAVCFDLDGVFFTEHSFRNFKTRISDCTNHRDSIDDVFHSSMMSDFKTNLITETTYWDYVRHTLEVTLTNEEIFRMLRESYAVNSYVKRYVCQLREAGYTTCLCSNNFITRIRELEEEFAFLKHFDTKIFSYDIGVLKPNVNIFKALVEQCGVDASELVYSDDSESNLSAAKELGVHTFIFKNINQFKHSLHTLGVSTEIGANPLPL
ncbi:MAG: HAD family hydrolase [Desulfobulbia bacterium]